MEFNPIQESPVPCRLCGTHNAPYLQTYLENVTILTPEGERLVGGQVNICVGAADRPGCVRNMVAAVGGQQPELVVEEAERHRAMLEEAERKHEGRLVTLSKVRELVRDVE